MAMLMREGITERKPRLNPQKEFLRYLRFHHSLFACDEVSSYGGIADVLALDHRKQHVIEYEFKRSSYDLKVAEKRKSKYEEDTGLWLRGKYRRVKHLMPEPHKFYFVVPSDLWNKEREYLESQHCGVISYSECARGLDFIVVKKCKLRKNNVQKYEKVMKDILSRLSSAYVRSLIALNK